MIYLIVFLPLLGFLFSSIIGNKLNNKFSQYITSGFLILSAFFSWIIFYKFLINKENIDLIMINWINSGDFKVDWAIRIDALSIIMLMVVSNISALIHIYSIGYMSKDPSIPRFMGYLSLFTFFMLALVTSNNLLQLFFGWEGVGLASYLLIGFWHHKETANNAAIKAFIVNRIGDFSFVIGIVGIYFIFGTLEFDEIFNQVDLYKESQFNFVGIEISTLNFLCTLLFIGAMGKSAQIGLHVWLPDAMEGPTPVSALIHAATMVTAGGFMVARMSPLFISANTASNIIILIGALTAIFAALIALTQNDIKKVIAYSTCSQLGYMFVAAGVGAYNAAIFHLTTHAFFKALLFLSAGSVIHALGNEQNMQKMGGLAKKIPITASMMWIGSLAIIGFPFLSGYYSKESIIESAYFANTSFGNLAYYVGIITSGLTAFYSWRLIFLTFYGKNRSEQDLFNKAHESPLVMIFPLILLSFGSIFVGVVCYDLFIGNNSINFWGNSIIVIEKYSNHMPFTQLLLGKLFISIGIILATVFYFYRNDLPKKLSTKYNYLYNILINKFYFDFIYNKIFVISSHNLGKLLWKQGDEKTIDGFGPDGLSKVIDKLSLIAGRFQTGYLYHYAFVMLIGLVGFLTWYLYV
ncbi:MAG: NADH-quinone oxidoreductase subunit L [Alphaproteobacteria bacterium MarineAlpha5_Bin11]|nr:MAG: NADH-quinone oxidoreductase subunit L [Alphaproteobacteria bacterium MarineAlpha5_Bin11]